MRWPFGKTYSQRCPDGSIKTVYRNIDDAFPLFIPGWQGDVTAGAGASAAAAGLGDVKAEVKGAYASKVQAVVFAIDELTQTVMINFRSVYLAFATDPCANSDFLRREIEKLVAEQQRIARLRIQAKALIELARAQPDQTVEILWRYRRQRRSRGGRYRNRRSTSAR